MPTYEYRCQTCDVNFDVVQSFADDTLAKCPTKKSGNSPLGCTAPGRGKVSKVFSAPGITFKGDGFYKTDSRSSSKAGASSKSGTSNGSSGSGESGESGGSGDSSSEKTTKTSSSDSKKGEGGPKKSETTSS